MFSRLFTRINVNPQKRCVREWFTRCANLGMNRLPMLAILLQVQCRNGSCPIARQGVVFLQIGDYLV